MRLVKLVAAIVCSSAVAHAEDRYTCKEAPPNSQLVVSFKPEVSLQDLVAWTMGFSCKNIVIAPDVAKHATRLTIVAPKKLTPKQALQLFVDAVEATGLVVTVKPDTIVIKLGPNMPKGCPDVAQAPAPPTAPEPGDAVPQPHSERVTKALETGLRKLDDFNYELTRATTKILLEDDTVLRGARVVPAIRNGKPEGVKLYAIRPASVFGRLGLLNGDTLLSVNGTAVTDGASVVAIHKQLAASLVDLKSPLAQVNVTVARRGQTATLIYRIK
jgi:hypothetical protein